MNIPTRVLKSTFITYDTYIQHQQLAKRFYKSNRALKKLARQGLVNDAESKSMSENEHVSLAIGEFKHSFKEDLIKWFFSLSLQEKIKAVAIENKWFSTMVQHMHSKYKVDAKIRFQLKLDDVPPDEYCYQSYIANQNPFNTEMNLDNFFSYKNDRHITEDRSINEVLFLRELRYFSLRETSDTLTLSTSILENECLFKYYIDTFSNDKVFMHHCTVSFDNVFKVYNWDFPEWFNPRDYNSISEFIIAYIEQVLSIRFWYALEEKKEKLMKNVQLSSIYEEPNFSEIFENRDKLCKFLKSEYKSRKDKLFNDAIDLRKLLIDIKSDKSIMSRVKKPKESMKNYFYLVNKTKFELFEPPIDNDYDIIEKLRTFFIESDEEKFIDELIFSKLDNLNTIEDFMLKKIFEMLHNIYSEKNANDLINEEFDVKQNSKIKGGRIKKHANKKKRNSKSRSHSINKAIELDDKKLIIMPSTSEGFKLKPVNKKDYNESSAKFKVSDEGGKMSWRKQSSTKPTEHPIVLVTDNKSSNSFSSNNEKQEESYVNNFVKNLIDSVVIDDQGYRKEKEETVNTERPISKISKVVEENIVIKQTKQEVIIKGSKLNTNTIKTNTPKPTANNTHNNKFNNKKVKKEPQPEFKRSSNNGSKRNSRSIINTASKEYEHHHETSEISPDVNSISNKTPTKNYSSDNECKIESINHEIIQNLNTLPTTNSNNIRVMVDNYSQTDPKRAQPSETSSVNPANSETVHSTTHDEEEKLIDFDNDQSIRSAPLITTNKTKKKNIVGAGLTKPAKIENFSVTPTSYIKPKSNILGLRKGISEGNKLSNPTSSKFIANTKKFPNKYYSHNDTTEEDYHESEDNTTSNYSKGKYNKNYSNTGSTYNYKKRGYNYGNKFEGGFYTKEYNHRPYYTNRSFMDFGAHYPYVMGGYPMYPYDDPTKESSIFNNYYIINSNVNIKGNEPNSNNININNSRINFEDNLHMNNGNFIDKMNTIGGSNSPTKPIFYNANKIETEEPNYNILNKIGDDVYPFIFHYKLHNDIIEYSKSVTEAINYLRDVKVFIVNFLENKIKEALGDDIVIDLYGSFATDLSIENSDIDITIKFPEDKLNLDIANIIDKICISFTNLNIFDNINPITTATVPVIKILVDPLNILTPESNEFNTFEEMKTKGFYKNYKFDIEELQKIKVDLTFIEMNQNIKAYNRYQSTKNSLEWAKKTLLMYPEIKPMIHVLKRYLQIKKLNSSFNGKIN